MAIRRIKVRRQWRYQARMAYRGARQSSVVCHAGALETNPPAVLYVAHPRLLSFAKTSSAKL
jgi:hypothetical protein